jgi:hypothetical protein
VKIKRIKAEQAPPKHKQSVSKMSRDLEAHIAVLGSDEVIQIQPDADQSIRGVKSSLTRTANRVGKKVETWDVDGTVYARLAG